MSTKGNLETFKKGTVIIVAQKDTAHNESFMIDGVVLYDSYCLSSSRPYLLQEKVNNLSEKENIYICGHGDSKEQTINGYSMKQIAEMLTSNYNYTGQQKIYIMACHSKHKNKNQKDMADLLTAEIEYIMSTPIAIKDGIMQSLLAYLDKLESTIIDSKFKEKIKNLIEGYENFKLPKDTIQSYAENTTVIVDYFGKAIVADKKLGLLFGNIQKKQQYVLGCRKLNISLDNIETQLNSYLEKYGRGIAIHNYTLIGEGGNNKMETRNILFWIVVIILIISTISIVISANHNILLLVDLLGILIIALVIALLFIAELPQCLWYELKEKFKKK